MRYGANARGLKRVCWAMALAALAGCSTNPSHQSVGTATGAAIGGVIGNQIGREADRKH